MAELERAAIPCVGKSCSSTSPANNKRRFYALSVQRTLFDEWVLTREWGRIGRGGRLRHDLYPSVGIALDALRELARSKLQRGYETV